MLTDSMLTDSVVFTKSRSEGQSQQNFILSDKMLFCQSITKITILPYKIGFHLAKKKKKSPATEKRFCEEDWVVIEEECTFSDTDRTLLPGNLSYKVGILGICNCKLLSENVWNGENVIAAHQK